jgi:hypothetical protein
MEIAIPMIALGGMYVIANQPPSNSISAQKARLEKGLKTIQQEEFTNMGARKVLPNTNTPPQNYPVTNLNELVDTVQNYANPNTATDKYFDQNYYERRENSGKKVGNNIQDIYSLTGNYLDSKEFKHNNMVPFYGGKIKGQVYGVNMAETMLDNMVGSGSQVIKKIEQAPLFKPQENMQWANGTPNMSDFFQSRVNPGMKNSNVKPFDSEYVGPGLDKGYTSNGSNGYNSGMEARDSWLPKTVDELRVATNPKLEYSLENHQGPSYAKVQNVGILGKVEKYHPDTFFINSQDRWLTTTGQEKGQALRPIQEVHATTRNTTASSYSGVAGGDKNASYVPSAYTAPKRVELDPNDVPASNAANRGPSEDGDAFIRSHTAYENNRSTSRQVDTYRSSFRGAIGAVIAPLMDAFRPTRKEEYGPNIRIYGDAGSNVKQNYVVNPGDAPATTIKETTLYSPNSYIGNQASVGYVLHNQQAIANQRDTTTCGYVGSVGGNGAARQGEVIVDAAYRQTNNDKLEATQLSYTPQGNTQIYNQQMNVNIARIDSDRDNPRMWVPNASTISQMPAGKAQIGQIRGKQQYDENKIGCERIQPDLLNAFRENPYTQSLQSWVNF